METQLKIKSTSILLAAVASVFAIPAPAANAAIGDCPSGSMCLWSNTNYSGTIVKISATNSYRSIPMANVRSYYNNRSQRTWLHQSADGSGDYVCLNPGAKKSSGLTGWMDNPKAVWLATVTNC